MVADFASEEAAAGLSQAEDSTMDVVSAAGLVETNCSLRPASGLAVRGAKA